MESKVIISVADGHTLKSGTGRGRKYYAPGHVLSEQDIERFGDDDAIQGLIDSGFLRVDEIRQRPLRAPAAQPVNALVDPFAGMSQEEVTANVEARKAEVVAAQEAPKDTNPGGVKMDHNPETLQSMIDGKPDEEALGLLCAMVEDKNQRIVNGNKFDMPESVADGVELLSIDFKG